MSTKRIAIITIVSQNYGNRLQNYALQMVLRGLGYEVITLRRNAADVSIVYKVKNYLHYIWRTNNTTQFFRFNKRIKWSRAVYTTNLNELNGKYDYFITGSDQVWNPYYSFTGTDLDFLTFTETDKRIAYAASFGVAELPEEKVHDFSSKLEGFEKISVREDAGADIIKTLSGKVAEVVLDPTMLLTAEQWRKIEKRPPNMPNGKYTLVYSVESMSEELRCAVEKEKEKGLVVDVREIDGKESAVGPSEFIYLIDNAEKMITDSFHGTVFSILFHTPFVIYNRNGINMNSRLETLLNSFELNNGITAERFCNVDIILDKKRQKSLRFLKNALENK